MRKRDAAAGKPAVTLPGIVTEQDRAIVARRQAGETIQAIATSLRIPASQVMRAEHRAYREQRAQEFFAKHPDSIRGLEWLGVLNEGAGPLRCHKYHYEGGDLERLSDVAALGRHYVSCLKGIGPKSLASIDRALGLFGMTWAPIDRTPTPKEREPEAAPASQLLVGSTLSHLLETINDLRVRVARLERRYVSSLPGGDNQDKADDAPSGDLETAGNLICLPGVKLADVQPNDGGRA